MHISVAVYGRQLGAVAFELNGTVLEPHELLQYDDRWFQVPPDGLGMDDALAAFVSRWLGKRGLVWSTQAEFSAFEWRCPWTPAQERDALTLIWAARKVPRINFKIPNLGEAGLQEQNPLHIALTRAIVMQGAFRALGLHNEAA